MRRHLQSSSKFIATQFLKIETLPKSHIASNEETEKKAERLKSAKRVGDQIARTLIDHIREVIDLTNKESAALVGVALYNKDKKGISSVIL